VKAIFRFSSINKTCVKRIYIRNVDMIVSLNIELLYIEKVDGDAVAAADDIIKL